MKIKNRGRVRTRAGRPGLLRNEMVAGRGMRQLAEAIEKEGWRVVSGVSYADASRLAEVFNSDVYDNWVNPTTANLDAL